MVTIARRIGAAILLASLAVLPGCGGGDDSVATPPPVAPVVTKLPVVGVVDLDLGRTFDGYALRAIGETETPGWLEAELRRRPAGLSAGGVIEFDLVALAPPQAEAEVEAEVAPQPAGPAPASVRRVEAHVFLPLAEIAAASAIRVHALAGSATVSFTRAEAGQEPRRRAGR